MRLHEVISGAVERLKESFAAKNIRVETDLPGALPALTVDKSKFVRLFELLLKDEVVSLPPGSQITLSARPGPEGVAPPTEVQVQIRDNGPGLPQDALRLIFDPFVLRSDAPMEYGLNLMACYFIVHHHGGRIQATSDPGKGTTFTLRLPINPNEAPRAEESEQFLRQIMLNDTLWERLLASD